MISNSPSGDPAGLPATHRPRILVVDNYDSFVYTLVGYVRQLGADASVVRNDVWDADEIPDKLDGKFDGVLLSPGPGTPSDSGLCAPIVKHCAAVSLPMLGVCLGHQVLAEVYGGTVAHAEQLMHGKTSTITNDGTGVFEGLPDTIEATRYHSLSVVPGTVDPEQLDVTARTADGVIMGLSHRRAPLNGVQFHPESVLTHGGYRLLANWLALAGGADPAAASEGLAPLVSAPTL